MARKRADAAPLRQQRADIADVFISHDSRDREIALAFARMLEGASGGKIRLFFSSDSRGQGGIPVGTEWNRVMLENLRQAKTVVALLTPRSLGRPWILFEVGYAKRRSGIRVFGLALGVSRKEASDGPFSSMQNSEDSEAGITKMVVELLSYHLGSAPEEKAILPLVKAFRRSMGKYLGKEASAAAKKAESGASGDREKGVQEESREGPLGYERTLGPAFFKEFPLTTARGFDALGWLVFIAMIRNEVPWVYEIGLELYKALGSRDEKEVRRARDEILEVVQRGIRNEWLLGAIAEENPRQANRLFHFADLIEIYLRQLDDESIAAATPPSERVRPARPRAEKVAATKPRGRARP